jgi:hypothetical protein
MVKIIVYRKSNGSPVKGARVRIGFGGEWSGTWGGGEEITDSDGEAHIDTQGGRQGRIFVNGKLAYEGRISGQETVYL